MIDRLTLLGIVVAVLCWTFPAFGGDGLSESLSAQVEWSGERPGAVNISRPIRPEFVDQCLKGGLEVEYRFLMQSCKRRSGWFDSCSRTNKQIHHLRYDPVRQTYVVVTDRLRDEEDPISTQVRSLSEALDRLDQIRNLPVEFLEPEVQNRLREGRNYLSLRFVSICKGEYNETLAQLSYMFTLGMVDLGEEDSGWIDFSLAAPEAASVG